HERYAGLEGASRGFQFARIHRCGTLLRRLGREHWFVVVERREDRGGRISQHDTPARNAARRQDGRWPRVGRRKGFRTTQRSPPGAHTLRRGIRLVARAAEAAHQLPDGTKLLASYHHAATIYEHQAAMCLSEPKTYELLRDQAQRVHAAWKAKAYMMSHDEL